MLSAFFLAHSENATYVSLCGWFDTRPYLHATRNTLNDHQLMDTASERELCAFALRRLRTDIDTLLGKCNASPDATSAIRSPTLAQPSQPCASLPPGIDPADLPWHNDGFTHIITRSGRAYHPTLKSTPLIEVLYDRAIDHPGEWRESGLLIEDAHRLHPTWDSTADAVKVVLATFLRKHRGELILKHPEKNQYRMDLE